MPEKLHKALEKEARKKFGNTTSERSRKFIYGTMFKYEQEHGNKGGKKGK